MQKQLTTWQFILQSLHAHCPVMLLYVLDSRGSSPGRQGFMMAVNAVGTLHGSLGGGIMEHKLTELARTRMKEAGFKATLHRQVHDKNAAKNQSGMICSGEQTVFMYQVKEEEVGIISALVNSLQRNSNGTLQLSVAGIAFRDDAAAADFSLELYDNDFLLKEKTGYKNTLYLIGAGHCALAFSRLMSTLDFHMTLFDTRSALQTMEQNNFVHRKMLLEEYEELERLVQPASNSFAVIMTVGYRTDLLALKALAGKSFSYIGMLGSRHKVSTLFRAAKEAGIDPGWLQKVHAPIGLPIKSQTPEEIAISIAAQIIEIKNRDR